jgi:uncharacterized membrane protein SpoIIM required for sporulation
MTSVISSRWIESRQPHWTRLGELLEQIARQGLRSLTRHELQELGLLYRQIASDLAALHDDPGSAHLAEYVNHLLARAHHTIYSADRQTPFAAIRAWIRAYPSVFRQHRAHCLVALAIFVVAAAVGATLTYHDPDFKTAILGPEMVATIDRHEMWTHSIVAIKPLASSHIMTNNMTVALVTFATGITFGIGTVYELALNGLMLSVVGMACALSGMSVQLWSFVAPHGVLELPATIIAGGAGLRLAQGLLFPGVFPRRISVALGGTDAVKLVLGMLPVLVVAGLIEAFVSPTDLAVASKFEMAAALFALFAAYLFWTPAPRATSDFAA